MRRAVAAACVALVTLAGCGTADDLDSAQAIADTIGCTGLHSAGETLAQEEQVCTLKGHDVSVIRFADDNAADPLLRLGESLGASYAKVNGHWYVSSEPRAFLDGIAAEHGWHVR